MTAAEWGLNYAAKTYGNAKVQANKLIINGQEIPANDIEFKFEEEQIPGMNIDLWNPPKVMPTTKTVTITTALNTPMLNQMTGILMGDDRDHQIECLKDDLEYLRANLREILRLEGNVPDEEIIERAKKITGEEY